MHTSMQDKPMWQRMLLMALAVTLILGLSPAPLMARTAYAAENQGGQLAAGVMATQDDATIVLEDGTYELSGLKAGPSDMFNHMVGNSRFLKVEGDTATIIFTQDGSTTSVGKYSRLALVKSHDFIPEGSNYVPDTELPEGTQVIEGTPAGSNGNTTMWHFEIALPKADVEAMLVDGSVLDITVWNNVGSSDDKIPGWYRAKNDLYLELGELGDKVNSVALTVTNNTGMFKVVSASYETAYGGCLRFALSGDSYDNVFKGTYEQAVANGDNRVEWYTYTRNADGKKEFVVPVAEGETFIPIVSISNSYLAKYEQGECALDRAFYPRQLTFDLDAATLVADDYHVSMDLAVTNSYKMFKVNSATFDTVGGPNSNGYAKTLNLVMSSDSYTKAFLGDPAAAALAEEGVVELGEGNTFAFKMLWMGKAGDPSSTVAKWVDGEPFIVSFWSAKNKQWYPRTLTLDEAAGTLITDNSDWVDPNPATTVDGLIAKIQKQVFTETTWADCEAAKAAWDALSDEEKLDVEEYDYFGLDTGDASADDPLNADEIGENEILVVSFGTSFNDSRALTIGGIEKALQTAYPDWSVRRAFTAQIIINHIYARDGIKIDNVKQAMDRAVENGVKNLVVQPTHLMHGAEYDELKAEIDTYADKMTISYAEPLLGEVGADSSAINDDKLAVAKAVVAEANVPSDTALVLMGHGTAHAAAITYEQMQTAMGQLGYGNVFIGTVEGEPEPTECSNVIAAVKAASYTKVVLRPLMVVAGDHANNDMADPDDEESWYSQFTAEGNFAPENVTCQIAGLGQIPAIQQIYVAHTAAAMPEPVEPIELTDGTYSADGLETAVLSMYHFHDAKVVIKGDAAWLVTTEDTDNTVKRFDGMAYGKQSEILDPADATNHTLVEGTVTANVVPIYAEDGTLETRTFVLPVPKSVFENGEDIYYMIKYVDGYSATHDGDWYKANAGDYYLTKYTLTKISDDTTLPGEDEPEPAKSGWVKEDGKWYYYNAEGVMVTSKWMKDSKGWCYLGADGAMVTSKWVKDSKGWCYVGTDGYMVYSKWVKDSKGWCYVGSNGYMVYSKWVKDSKGWCYVGSNGYMVYSKWVKDSKGWCYVGSNGYMVYSKWVKDSKGWCYVGSNGYMVTNGWAKDSKGWCYMDSKGYAVTSAWKKISDKWYYFDSGSHMVTGKQTINGKTYTFDSKGVWIS